MARARCGVFSHTCGRACMCYPPCIEMYRAAACGRAACGRAACTVHARLCESRYLHNPRCHFPAHCRLGGCGSDAPNPPQKEAAASAFGPMYLMTSSEIEMNSSNDNSPLRFKSALANIWSMYRSAALSLGAVHADGVSDYSTCARFGR